MCNPTMSLLHVHVTRLIPLEADLLNVAAGFLDDEDECIMDMA